MKLTYSSFALGRLCDLGSFARTPRMITPHRTVLSVVSVSRAPFRKSTVSCSARATVNAREAADSMAANAECDVGIKSYISPFPGFSAVLKQRFTGKFRPAMHLLCNCCRR